jgi:hypothetical protein
MAVYMNIQLLSYFLSSHFIKSKPLHGWKNPQITAIQKNYKQKFK